MFSRKHRKFATDDGNFVDIDALIMRVQRPTLRQYYEDDASSSSSYLEEVPSSQHEENMLVYDEFSKSTGSLG
jgi:hypothetical protein